MTGPAARIPAETPSRARVLAPYLIQNNWLAATVDGGKFAIRLGERAKKLREGKEDARAAA